MKRKQRSIVRLLLVPLIGIVLFQGILLCAAFFFSHIRETISKSTVERVNHVIENRSYLLQNTLNNEWSTIRNDCDLINQELEGILQESQCTIDEFVYDEQAKKRLITSVFPQILEKLRYNSTGGSFLILTNGTDYSETDRYQGFFLRDSDAATRNKTDSDIFMERGDSDLAREAGIALDSTWQPKFVLEAAGECSADEFFFSPLLAAVKNPDISMLNLSYWSKPFILEDNELDNHRMITYSIPLIYEGTVYGVLGSEVAISHILNYYLDLRELDSDQIAGYILAVKQSEDTYEEILGKGSLYDTVIRENRVIQIEDTDYSRLKRIKNADIGDQSIYGICSGIKIFENNTPYEQTDWTLIGLVTEKSIFHVGNQLYHNIAVALLFCALTGVLIMIVAVSRISKPVHILMDSIRAGREGLKRYPVSGIEEIDELHSVISNLTESEKAVAERLEEEKERYKIAVESSNDIFFSYYVKEKQLEIVNSINRDGSWDLSDANANFLKKFLSEESYQEVCRIFEGEAEDKDLELPVKVTENQIRWYRMRHRLVYEEENKTAYIIGYLRDIQEEKLLEQELERKVSLDSLTELLCLEPGIKEIDLLREKSADGLMIMLDIKAFREIIAENGMAFGDCVIAEFSNILRESVYAYRKDTILIRAGADVFLIWLKGCVNSDAGSLYSNLNREITAGLRHQTDIISIRLAAVSGTKVEKTELLVQRLCKAMEEAKQRNLDLIYWNSDMGILQEFSFNEIISQGNLKQQGFSSIAMTILDRSKYMEGALDLLACIMHREYGLSNLAVTSFHGEFRSSVLEYTWKVTDSLQEKRTTIRHSTENYEQLAQQAHRGSIVYVKGENLFEEMKNFGACFIYPLSNYGIYCGSIFFAGEGWREETETELGKMLREFSAILQHRINQEYRDQSAQAKANFLANMSHEIRTPMNGIIGMTELALQDGKSEEFRLECLKKVRASSNYLLGLLNDVLDMSKIENGKMRLIEEDFSLEEMIGDLHTILDVKFEEKRQIFIIDSKINHPWIRAARMRLNQILINLLGNAIKYSGTDTEVLLTIREEAFSDGKVTISFAVTDHGIGIREEDQKRIFYSFEQVDTAAVHQQGTGLGLAISNHLLRMMNSTIELESTLGEGSTFRFSLVVPVAQPQEDKLEEVEKKDFSGKRILVAEDNALNREVLQTILEDMGIIVDTVENGKLAVDYFINSRKGYYQMIIMDIMMPEMGGYEATHIIRSSAHADAEDIPIIAMSANAYDDDVKTSLASGMNTHLSKPIEIPCLMKELNKYLV